MVSNKEVSFIIIAGKKWNKTHRKHKLKMGHFNNREQIHLIFQPYALLFRLAVLLPCDYQ